MHSSVSISITDGSTKYTLIQPPSIPSGYIIVSAQMLEWNNPTGLFVNFVSARGIYLIASQTVTMTDVKIRWIFGKINKIS